MDLRHEAGLKQQTALSPRLYQSMKVLRMSAGELMELLRREMEENPALEIPEPSDLEAESNAAEQQLWEELTRAERGSPRLTTYDTRSGAAELASSPVSLADHLRLQLDLEDLPEAERRIGLTLIGSLDDHGYLADSLDCISEATGRPREDVETVLAVIQGFDPPGVGARDLEECLLIQLRLMQADRLAREIVTGYLPLLARNAHGEIAAELGVSRSRVEAADALIRELNPSPGSLFDTGPVAGAVIPDVYVRLTSDGIRVLANREALPPLKLSERFKELSATSEADAGAREYIKEKLREAASLIQDFQQRRSTLSRVARAIAEEQEAFFEHGPAHLRPLTIEEIARKLDVHPSTISRAVLDKFMNTPFGIFEFRYFFSAGYDREVGALSANAVKKRIGAIVNGEDPLKPLSDQKITAALAKADIKISRRTVAKYREELGILPSWQRKKVGRCRQVREDEQR